MGLFILWLSSSFSEHTQSTGEASALLVPGSVGSSGGHRGGHARVGGGHSAPVHPRPSLPEKPGRRWLMEGGQLAPGPAGRVEKNKGQRAQQWGRGLEPEAGVGGLLKEAGGGARGGGGRAGAAPGAAGEGPRAAGGWAGAGGGGSRGASVPLSRPRPPRGPARVPSCSSCRATAARCRTGSRCPRPRSTSRWGRRPSSAPPSSRARARARAPPPPAPLSSAPASSASSSARLPPPPAAAAAASRRLGRPRPAQRPLPVGRTRWRRSAWRGADPGGLPGGGGRGRSSGEEAASWRGRTLPRDRHLPDLKSFLASQPVEWGTSLFYPRGIPVA